jgi:ABC-2 type transport system ATP-binding protein
VTEDGFVEAVRVDELAVQLGAVQAVGGITVAFADGVTALLGRNGAGKTTLIRVLATVLRPAHGELLVGNAPVHRDADALRAYRARLGWLPQEPGYPARMRVEDFLAYAAWLKDIPSRDVAGQVDGRIEDVNLSSVRRRRLGRLSGGQRRRAVLAAALIGQPNVLLLDEPTNGLDPSERDRFLKLVREQSRGRCVIMATHLLEDVALAADSWVALDQGRVMGQERVDRSSSQAAVRSVDRIRRLLLEPPPET